MSSMSAAYIWWLEVLYTAIYGGKVVQRVRYHRTVAQ